MCKNIATGATGAIDFKGNAEFGCTIDANCLVSCNVKYSDSLTVSSTQGAIALCGSSSCEFTASAEGTLSLNLDVCKPEASASGSVKLGVGCNKKGGILSAFTFPPAATVAISKVLDISKVTAIPIAGITSTATGPYQLFIAASKDSGFTGPKDAAGNPQFQVGFSIYTELNAGDIDLPSEVTDLTDYTLYTSPMLVFTGVTNPACTAAFPPGGSSSSTCFPANSLVQLEDGSAIAMDTVQVGHKVRVGPKEHSEVYMFSHQYTDALATFVELKTATGTIQLTADHYIYANGKAIPAGSVKVGDLLETAEGKSATVTGISTIRATGLYNPHTMQGDIVVNGFRTTTYTKAINPTLAHALLAPIRAMHTMNVTLA